MRNLAVVCLLIGSLNVSYGQQTGCGCPAEGPCEMRASARYSQPQPAPQCEVPRGYSIFQVAPSPAVPPLPCPANMLPPLAAWQATSAPPVVRLPQADDDRLGHLLEAAEHLTAAGEAQQARRVLQMARLQQQKLLARLRALRTEVAELRRRGGGYRLPDHARQDQAKGDHPQQILVALKLVELNLTKMRALGIDFTTLQGDGVEPAAYTPLHFGAVDDAQPVLAMLEALQKDGLAKVLAQPTIVTVSGRPASFHAGQQVPALVSEDDGSQRLEFRECGTKVDLVAIHSGEGRIRLEIRFRNSRLDPVLSLPGDPQFARREAETAVELGAGQTVILSGMARDHVQAKPSAIPWVKNIPYLGELLAATQKHRQKTKLMLLARVDLIAPPDPAEVPPAGPGMRTTSPDDREAYLRPGQAPDCCPSDLQVPSECAGPQAAPDPITTRPHPPVPYQR